MKIELSSQDRLQFQYILPVQGDLKTLELVESILEKIKITDGEDYNSLDLKVFEFKTDEIELIKNFIKILNDNKSIRFESLSLVKKILNGEKK
jgi:hypothetical protein